MAQIYVHGGHLYDEKGEQVMIKGGFAVAIVKDGEFPRYITDVVNQKVSDAFLVAKAVITAINYLRTKWPDKEEEHQIYVPDMQGVRLFLVNDGMEQNSQSKRVFNQYRESYTSTVDDSRLVKHTLHFMADEERKTDTEADGYFNRCAKMVGYRILSRTQEEAFRHWEEKTDLATLIELKGHGKNKKTHIDVLVNKARQIQAAKDSNDHAVSMIDTLTGSKIKHVRVYLYAEQRIGRRGHGGFCSQIFLPGHSAIKQYRMFAGKSDDDHVFSNEEAYMRGLLAAMKMTIRNTKSNTLISVYICNQGLIDRLAHLEDDEELGGYAAEYSDYLLEARDKDRCYFEVLPRDPNYKLEPYTGQCKEALQANYQYYK